jgi:hypothetical protein
LQYLDGLVILNYLHLVDSALRDGVGCDAVFIIEQVVAADL